jgi:hypothetical protein
MICGFPSCGESLSILLHEIQHAIQHKESFATGGNEFLASFVVALGGKEVRKIFSSINKIEKYLEEYFNTDEYRLEIKSIVENEMVNNDQAEQIRGQLLTFLDSYENYSQSLNQVNFYIILFIAENGDYATSGLTSFLVNKVGYVIYEIFENITKAYKEAINYKNKLASEGYKKEDISRILFSSYENLYGETESRATQSSRYLGSDYKNYFYLNGWENGVLKNLVVIDGIDEIVDSEKIKAAVERKGDEYVLHFEKNRSSEPFLHELGHIVYDCLVKLGYKDLISKELDASTESKIQEKFVNTFLAYIRDILDDKNIKADLMMDFSIQANEEIYKVLDEFFRDSEINERTKYIKYMLEIV